MAISAPVVATLLGLVSLGLLGLLAWLVWRASRQAADVSAFRSGGRIRRVHLPDAPGVVVEIDGGWPGRTRIRVPAPAALPLQGPARLAPRGLRSGRALSGAFGDLVWSGRGADDVADWTESLQEPLRALWGWRDRYTLQATLTPYGLLIHMPLVAAEPNEESFLAQQARLLHAALAAMAAGTRLEGITFQSPMTEAEGDCSTCWDRIPAREAVLCPACGGCQHRDCHEWTGGCGRFACDGEDKLESSLRAARR
jgi:hypothetical protein